MKSVDVSGDGELAASFARPRSDRFAAVELARRLNHSFEWAYSTGMYQGGVPPPADHKARLEAMAVKTHELQHALGFDGAESTLNENGTRRRDWAQYLRHGLYFEALDDALEGDAWELAQFARRFVPDNFAQDAVDRHRELGGDDRQQFTAANLATVEEAICRIPYAIELLSVLLERSARRPLAETRKSNFDRMVANELFVRLSQVFRLTFEQGPQGRDSERLPGGPGSRWTAAVMRHGLSCLQGRAIRLEAFEAAIDDCIRLTPARFADRVDKGWREWKRRNPPGAIIPPYLG